MCRRSPWPLAERIRASVAPNADGCWVWRRGLDGHGYGSISIKNRSVRASRASWLAFNGEIPPGQFVCHSCDNRLCVNPEHLFLGSAADNNGDMAAKGRARNAAAKVTAAQVLAIRADARPQGQIAADYGIDRSAVSLIKARKTWRNVA
jgi:hypothetical protein